MEILDQGELVSELLRLNEINDPAFQSADTETKLRILAGDLLTQTSRFWLDKFITQDDQMQEVKKTIRLLANTEDPVLITGPSGTGKELLAHALHGNRSGEFLPLNCGAINENLIESELFGHVRGSFTGAQKDYEGVLRAAGNGVVFLDEIGDLPLSLQCKLLRAIQEGHVRPIGSPKEIKISCRFVCATKHDLRELVAKSQFREDLYARIFTFEVDTTPLVMRPGDIPLILKFLQCTESEINTIQQHTDFYPYVDRFNVRALQAFARRLKVLGKL